MKITLVKVVGENLKDVTELKVDEKQSAFYQENVLNIAIAAVSVYSHLYHHRAICTDDKIVGFAQYQFGEIGEWDENECTIWSFMMDKKYQRKGFGRSAMELLINEIKAHNRCQLIDIYYHPGNEPAKKLYAYHGFKETGFRDNGDVIAELEV